MSEKAPSDTERVNRLRLIRTENVGPVAYQQLMAHYGSASDALEALPELSRKGGMSRSVRIYSQDAAERDFERAELLGARFVCVDEDDYPSLMKHIDGPPPLVCIKGKPSVLSDRAIAIVGSRNASANGRKLARQLAGDLGNRGFIVVSGLARGIDTAAHQASLATGTVAVLAGGLDRIYPPENQDLYHAIAETGLLISEMAPGTEPRAEFFPRRNRLISGMSRGVVVVEAVLRSGSLITARLAGEQGRDVFAVPGSPMDPRAAGTNRLIRDGAVLTRNAQDVLDVVEGQGIVSTDSSLVAPLPGIAEQTEDDRARIVTLLGASPVDIDDLTRESGCHPQHVATVLLELELAGKVQRFSGQRVALIAN